MPLILFDLLQDEERDWISLATPEGNPCCLVDRGLPIRRRPGPDDGVTPAPEILLWVATAVGGVIAAPFLQALASAAGESAYQFIRSRFQRHKKVSELPPGHQVIRLSTLDYRMHVEIPGTVTEEALQAFIDQMPTLLADAPESHVINIHWHGGPEWHRQDME